MVSRFRPMLLSLLCALTLGAFAFAAISPVTQARAEEADTGLGLVYLDREEVGLGDVQSIAVLAEEDAPELAGATLTVTRGDGSEERTLEAAKVVDGAALLELTNDDASLAGEWRVMAATLRWVDGTESVVALDDVEDLAFTLAPGPIETPETTFTTVDGDGEVVTSENLADVTSTEVRDAATPMALAGTLSLAHNTLDNAVVALDPGHGAEDGGATGIGFLEKDANWKISMATKRWLEANGVKVFVTHGQNESPNPSIYERVQRAMNAGACVFVSQHNNSTPGGTGSEIFIPAASSFYPSLHDEGRALADELAPRLQALGLHYRGTSTRVIDYDWSYNYADGSLGDYYGIIRYSRQQGVTGVLIEHAFVDTPSDAALLRNDAFLEKLGAADAEAIYARLESLYANYCRTHGRTYVSPEEETRQATEAIDRVVDDGVFRLYNRYNGCHLFTTDDVEAKSLLGQGWRYEQAEWVNPSSGGDVYRLHNPSTGEHLYTTNPVEYDELGKLGWSQEGVKLHTAEPTATGAVAVYRLFNPNTDQHHFTTDANEYRSLQQLGWQGEDIQLYGLDPDGPGTDTPQEPPVPEDPPEPENPAEPENPVTPDDPAKPEGTSIMAQSATSQEALRDWFARSLVRYDYPYPSLYAEKGAATAQDFVDILWEEATDEGVRPDVLLAQIIHETGWLQFGNLVTVDQCNFGGLGASDDPANRDIKTFPDVRTGLRASTQHLRAYADATVTKDNLAHECVDPRFNLVARGCSPTVEGLSGKWSSKPGYGESIVDLMEEFPNDLA